MHSKPGEPEATGDVQGRGSGSAASVGLLMGNTAGGHHDTTRDKRRHLAYFAFDSRNEGIKRRLNEALRAGYDITMFAFERARGDETTAASIDSPRLQKVVLGRTRNGSYIDRVAKLLRATWLVLRQRALIRQADVIVARNMDMALLALVVRSAFARRTPLVYEVLDIVPLMGRPSLAGRFARAAESLVLRSSRALIVSSPGFLHGYFDVFHRHVPAPTVIENKVSFPVGVSRPTRSPAPGVDEESPVWVIGWFGKFRCRTSFGLLTALARRLPHHVQVYLRGYPDQISVEDFAQGIKGLPNIKFEGGYRTPADLPTMMSRIHLNWCADLADSAQKQRWLLPNRIYEGGYFGVPALTFEGSETSDYVKQHGLGYVLPSPDLDTLVDFVASLTPDEYREMRALIARRPAEQFVDDGAFPRALQAILEDT